MIFKAILLCATLFVCAVHADLYMHNPRGSNNRLTEPNANRQNDQRLFDSQNNNKGGYCWGPKMYYYVGSQLTIEWTNQHSCGEGMNDCDIVIQYMCHPNQDWWAVDGRMTSAWDDPKNLPRDGYPDGDTNDPLTPDYCQSDRLTENNNQVNAQERFDANCDPNRHDAQNGETPPKYIYGLHETYEFYHHCYQRERNKGLFNADRNVNNNRGASSTRQNTNGNDVRNNPSSNNGNRPHGYECPEERDYYPYWSPQPWKDIAILTTRTDMCEEIVGNSQNIKESWFCYMDTPPIILDNNGQPLRQDRIPSSQIKCEEEGGSWRRVKPLGGGKPECLKAPWTRDNHLGNANNGYMASYNWTIPNDVNPSCVLRLRYNITTKDGQWNKPYYKLTAGDNGGKSPVSQNPDVMISPNTEYSNPPQPATAWRLRLAINTAQFGRVFEDRSHTFEIRARDGGIPANARIYNLNVRGKRGNIVQTYPAIEYDFVPTTLHVKTNDYIHIQWTGCDNGYPNNQNGEGRDKTDRSNMVGLLYNELGGNIPHRLNDTYTQDSFFGPQLTQLLAWIGQVDCLSDDELDTLCGNGNNDNCNLNVPGQDNPNRDQYVKNCGKLNAAATPYFDGGLVKITKSALWNYISTRENNFSNRSQKGIINSQQLIETYGIALLAISGAGFAAAVVIAVAVKLAPGSAVAAAATGV